MPVTSATIESELQRSAVLFRHQAAKALSVSGSDSTRYLQGRVTQDIKSLTAGTSAEALLLNSQGRIQGSCLVLAQPDIPHSPEQEPDPYLIVANLAATDSAESEFIKTLLQFKVSDDIKVTPHPLRFHCYSLHGAKTTEVLLRAGVPTVPTSDYQHTTHVFEGLPIVLLGRSRTELPGVELLIPETIVEQFLNTLSLTPAPESAWQWFRIWRGIPEAGVELTDKSIATEIDISNSVSFRKGCYVGQEVVEMSTARGRPNRRLTTLSVPTEVSVGSTIHQDSRDGKVVGEITSAAYETTAGNSQCLAFIKTSVPADATLWVAGVIAAPSVPAATR